MDRLSILSTPHYQLNTMYRVWRYGSEKMVVKSDIRRSNKNSCFDLVISIVNSLSAAKTDLYQQKINHQMQNSLKPNQ